MPGVVRIGDTVRRPAGPHSTFTAMLLAGLAAAGFTAAPRHLGTDERGRDILTFLEGTVPDELGWYGDAVLAAAASLIRRYHDATEAIVPQMQPSHTAAEVICHNDLSPCNFVLRNGAPAALIDFDAAAPGLRAWDLGYAAWLWLNIGQDAITPAEQARRLALFVNAYGSSPSQSAVVEAMCARQTALLDEGRKMGRDDMAAWASDCHDWTRKHL